MSARRGRVCALGGRHRAWLREVSDQDDQSKDDDSQYRNLKTARDFAKQGIPPGRLATESILQGKGN